MLEKKIMELHHNLRGKSEMKYKFRTLYTTVSNIDDDKYNNLLCAGFKFAGFLSNHLLFGNKYRDLGIFYKPVNQEPQKTKFKISTRTNIGRGSGVMLKNGVICLD